MSCLRPISCIAASLTLLSAISVAQTTLSPDLPNRGSSFFASAPSVTVSTSTRLSPEAALATYERELKNESTALAGYTAVTVIDAELPESSQRAEFELRRRYVAPSALEFTPVRSQGDQFVKSNVIARLLQSEVEHVRKKEQSQVAINSENYKFGYKGTTVVNGAAAHVYDVKPRRKRAGLFKGKICVDAISGRLLRAQGRILKSPSLFIKRIDFVQDYETVAGFTFPAHLHSEASTRLVGRAIVNILQKDFEPEVVGGASHDAIGVASYTETN